MKTTITYMGQEVNVKTQTVIGTTESGKSVWNIPVRMYENIYEGKFTAQDHLDAAKLYTEKMNNTEEEDLQFEYESAAYLHNRAAYLTKTGKLYDL